MKFYYYSQNDIELGPFTFDELKTKRLKKSTLVWTDGLEEWIPAEKLDELKDIIVSEPPPLVKKEHIQAVAPSINSGFDPSYKRETQAAIFGASVIVITIALRLSGVLNFEDRNSYYQAQAVSFLISLILRIIASVWVTSIAKRQNRNATTWGIFAFFLPTLALIIIGLSRKLKFTIKFDKTLSKIEQYKKLKEQADGFSETSRYDEAKTIYKYLIDNCECSPLDSYELGFLHFTLKEYKAAQDIFNETKLVSDLEIDSKYYLGFIAFKEKKIETAKTYLEYGTSHGDSDCQILLNTINLTDPDNDINSSLEEKYGLTQSIKSLDYILIIQSPDSLSIKVGGKYKYTISLFFNGIVLTSLENKHNKKGEGWFLNFSSIQKIVRTEGDKFNISLTNHRTIFCSIDDPYGNRIETIENFIGEFEQVMEDFNK